jgi:hypothetical protein
MHRNTNSNSRSKSRARLVGLVLCAGSPILAGCSSMPFVQPAESRLGTEITTLTPSDSKRLMQDELWNTANLIGGQWKLEFSPIPYRCTTAGGDEGARYEGVLRLTDAVSADNFGAVADAIAARLRSQGFHVRRAAYTPDNRIVMGADAFGAELSYTRESTSTVLIGGGACVPTDYKKLRYEEGQELDRTGTPQPTAPGTG